MVQVDERESAAQPELSPGQRRRSFQDFLPRLLSALVLAPIALGITYLGGWPFALLVTLASGIALVEWLRITDNSDSVVFVLNIACLIASVAAVMFGRLDYAIISAVPLAGFLWFISKLRWKSVV